MSILCPKDQIQVTGVDTKNILFFPLHYYKGQDTMKTCFLLITEEKYMIETEKSDR